MQNLKRNWLVISKLTWGIWQILTRALEVSKIFILMGSFWAKYILFELKKYRGVIFHETEEGYKIWREIDLSFQNWHKKFDKFWPEHSSLKNIHFNGLRLIKVYIVWVKKVQRNSFMALKSDAKFEEKLACCLKNDVRNLASFHQSTRKCQN